MMALRNTFVAITLLSFICLVQYSVSVPVGNVTRTKVLILGAGAAGIGFANKLFENGVKDFIILDAQNYVGGRVRDTKLAGLTIQEGAAWIHDIGAENPFYVLKTKFGLKATADNYSDFIVKDMQGNVVSGSQATYKRFKSTIEKLWTMNAVMEKNKESDIPLKTAFQMVGWNPKTNLEKVIDYYMSDFENEMPPWLLSARQTGFTGTGSDEVVTDQRGYKYIMQQVAKSFTNSIHLNTTVNSITYDNNTATVNTTTGAMYVADHAYVTFSTGVLSSSRVQFIPALPAWKMKSVYMMPMSHYTKIFLKFPTKFWDDNRYILIASEKRGYYVHYQNLDRAGLFPGQKMLVATVTGSESQRVEKLTDAQVKEEVMSVLKKVYPSATNATDIFVSRWSRDPLTLGAYSSPVIGVDKYTFLHLRAPVTRALWFGGEAATNPDDFGYAHGAYKSGTEQGGELVKCIKDKNHCPVYKPRPKPCPVAPKPTSNPKAGAVLFGTHPVLAMLVLFLLVSQF